MQLRIIIITETQLKTTMQATLTAASILRPTADRTAVSHPEARTDATPTTVDSSALLQGQKAVAIHHNGAVYRLQATRLGKLILTK